jgi:hypothetical protein
MLAAELELTADLRLDSLARVELLIALRTRLPNPPEISVGDACEFRTLGDLKAALEGKAWPGLPDDVTHVHAEVPRPDGPGDPLAWTIEQFVSASGATALRDVSLLRDPGTATGPITVHGQGKRLALVSDVTHGTARIAVAGPSPVTFRNRRELGECLEIAARWARREFGGAALAASVREVRLHRANLLTPLGEVSLTAGRVRDGRAECDVLQMDAHGSTRVELRGVRLFRHPR